MASGALSSRRLEVRPLSADALAALIAGDRGGLEAMTEAVFPTPLTAPPLMDDALPFMSDLLARPENGCWGPYLMVLRETGEAVGSAGFTGRPAEDGVVTLGYSVYPPFEGCGFASEAAEALVSWAMAQPGIRSVRATIPPDHAASQRLAARAGLHATGRIEIDPDEGPVEVWERAADAP